MCTNSLARSSRRRTGGDGCRRQRTRPPTSSRDRQSAPRPAPGREPHAHHRRDPGLLTVARCWTARPGQTARGGVSGPGRLAWSRSSGAAQRTRGSRPGKSPAAPSDRQALGAHDDPHKEPLKAVPSPDSGSASDERHRRLLRVFARPMAPHPVGRRHPRPDHPDVHDHARRGRRRHQQRLSPGRPHQPRSPWSGPRRCCGERVGRRHGPARPPARGRVRRGRRGDRRQ
jgi:hypothetical protein